MPHPSDTLIETLEGIRRRVKTFAVTYGAGLASRWRWGCCC
jgi:hypothetical protein